eukprot:3045249-Pleurochrysis_carterae.AAC.1
MPRRSHPVPAVAPATPPERVAPACALATPLCGVAREHKTPPPHGGGCCLLVAKYLDHIYYENHIL